jgi:Ca-activated chloride channel family protein
MLRLPFSFARPELLTLLLALPALVALAYYAVRRRRALLHMIGQPEAIAALSSLPPKRRARSRLCLLGSIMLIVVALAGPRWGRGDSGVVIGRDLVIVLDLSKSMLAEDVTDGRNRIERWRAARAGIHDLIASIRLRGGHRIGLVVFAAKPWVVCPLTADYDHFTLRLDEFDPLGPPREVNPDKEREETFPSGTRIGSAIKEAVETHDPRLLGYQDILLISDGDDPAPDADIEIEVGVEAARKTSIPVHVAGVGDPSEEAAVGYKRPDGQEEFFRTKLHDKRLREIARQTRGEYLSDHHNVPRLGEFFQSRIESRPSRELPDDALPQPRERYLWFLIPALVLLVAAWWVEP